MSVKEYKRILDLIAAYGDASTKGQIHTADLYYNDIVAALEDWK